MLTENYWNHADATQASRGLHYVEIRQADQKNQCDAERVEYLDDADEGEIVNARQLYIDEEAVPEEAHEVERLRGGEHQDHAPDPADARWLGYRGFVARRLARVSA